MPTFGLCLAAAMALLGAHIWDGGRYLDDWWLSAYAHFPRSLGFGSAYDYLTYYSGGRVGGTAYWLVAFSWLGSHPELLRAAGVAMAALLTLTFYLLLRELQIERLEAGAIALLSLAVPVADSIHFWLTPQVAQLCLACCAGGLLLAVRGVDRPPEQALALRAGSLCLYGLSLLIAETMMPAVALSILIYRTRTSWKRARAWWMGDLVLVALAVLHYVLTAPTRRSSSGGSGSALHHAAVLANQAITLFTGTLVPFAISRAWVLGALACLSGILAWRWQTASPVARAFALRWLLMGMIAAVLVLASYAVYVPADPGYQPLVPGIGNRMNIGALLPFTVLLFVPLRLIGGLAGPGGRALLVTGVLFAVVLVGAVSRLEADRELWDVAASHQRNVLSAVHRALPHPPGGSTLLLVNTPGVVTRFESLPDGEINEPAPVFSTWWEVNSAVKLSYNRGDLSAYPIWAEQPPQLACGVHDVYQWGLDALHVRHAVPYGHVYLVNVATAHATRIDGQVACLRVTAQTQTLRFDLPV